MLYIVSTVLVNIGASRPLRRRAFIETILKSIMRVQIDSFCLRIIWTNCKNTLVMKALPLNYIKWAVKNGLKQKRKLKNPLMIWRIHWWNSMQNENLLRAMHFYRTNHGNVSLKTNFHMKKQMTNCKPSKKLKNQWNPHVQWIDCYAVT